MAVFNLSDYLTKRRKIIEEELKNVIEGIDEASGTLKRAMKYSLFSGGKRIRPIFAFAAAEAVGGTAKDALPAAIALELIHTYSLVHDDLPAMDDDDLRRGLPTSHKVFGEAQAVLAGDALLTKAFSVLTDFANNNTNPKKLLMVAHEIAQAAGEQGMLGGQIADIESERKEIDLPSLEFIHIRKTGALILASIRSGAILVGTDEDKLGKLSKYGRNIGLAFQISDDILDVVGDKELMGKKPGQDHVKGKATYPALLGLSESKKMAEKLVEKAIEALSDFGKAAEPLRAIGTFIIERQS
jgi:geranylgeranyl diphosphate synthase, type II